MDFAATQVYEDEDFPFTQRISHIPEEKGPIQIGTLRIQSTEYQIKKGITKIGRHSSSDIVIKDVTVSNIHAEIESTAGEGSTWICDLDSSNKTKLNNLTLRPNRSYELKDGSVIEFGKVRATYQTYRPANDTIIPETPVPMQRVVGTIIPNTPDSSLNNSSSVDNDGSVIPGTQKDEENNIFQRPLDPQQNQSTNVGKRNTFGSSLSVNDDSQGAALLHVSNVDVSQTRKVSIFDMDTQKFGEEYVTSTSIHNIETQKFVTKELFKTNATSKKQLSKNDIRDELAEGNNVANIHNVKTQNYINDDKTNEEYTRSSKIDSHYVTAKKFTMDIHDIETQNYVGTAEDKTRQSEINRSKTQMKNMDRVERNTHNFETELDKTHSVEVIYDMETQLESNDSINKANNKLKNTINEGRNKDNILATKNGTRYEKNTKLSSSRSSSPASLNLSSPGIDEECPSSLLNESVHLLESSSLLEYFSEGIDKHEKMQASTPKSKTYFTERHIDNIRNMSNVSDNENDNDEDNIFDIPTQRVNRKFEDLLPTGDSQNDEKNAIRTHNNSKKKCGTSRLPSDDSETDAEDYIEELVKKQRESLEASNKLYNESSENRNESDTSIDSEDMFDMPTQRLKDHTSKNTSNSSFNRLRETNKIDIDDMAPTQPINNRNTCDQVNQSNALSTDVNDVEPSTQPAQPRGTSLKIVIASTDSSPKNNRNNVNDIAVTKIININADVAEAIDVSDRRMALENLDCEDIDYEMAPTQIIDKVNDKEKGNLLKKNLDHDKTVESLEVNLNDIDEDNIFDVPTQRVNRKFEDLLPGDSQNDEKNAIRTHNNSKKNCGTSRLPSDDSETDAEDYIEELVKKQRESLEASNKLYNESSENRNESDTSIDSEDMFDMPTQRLKDHTSKNTSNSSFNRLRETNKIDIDDMAPTQPINNRNTCDQVNQSNALSTDVNDVEPSIQPAQPRGTSLKTVIASTDSSPKNNRNNVNDIAVTKIININADVAEAIDVSDRRMALENLDCEDIDYEMAPTQIIDKVNDKEKGNALKKNLYHDKTIESSEVNLNDTLERNLNEMFSDLNNDSIQEPPQMSTQNLEDILESQYNNDLDDVNKSTVDDTNNISRTQSDRKSRSRSSRNLSRKETNKDDVSKAETDSQNSDVYFSTIRKRNIITNTQELTCTVEKSSGQDNSSRKSKEKSENELTKSNRKGKKAIKSKHRSIVITDDLNKNNVSKTILLMKQEGEITLETSEQVLARDSRKVDDTEKDLESSSNIYASCSSKREQRAQMSNMSYENDDDDILIRLPAVRISGTHSNPPSPSVSSTSIASVESKKNVTKRKSKRLKSARAKLLSERVVENSKKDDKPSGINDESSVPLSTKTLSSSVVPILRIKNMSKITTSSDSDSETSYKRFKQMADKVLNNESNYTKKRNKDNIQSTNKSAIFNKKKNALSSFGISKSSEENSDAQTPKSPIIRSSSRSMRYHNRQSKDNSCVLQVMKDMHAKNKTDTSTKVETVSIAPNRKRSLHAIEEDAEQKSKKRKADRVIEEFSILTRSRRRAAITNRQFANNFEYSVKTNSRASSPVIGNTRSSEDGKSASEIMFEKTRETSLNPRTDGDVDAGKCNVKRIRRKINDNQAVTRIDDVITTNKNSNKAKQEQAKKEETGMSLMGDKIIKIVLDPLIKGNESQEVTMIMKEASNNARDDNLPIKEKNNARTLQRKSRNIRGKKKSNTDNDIDSVSAASSASFDISDSNNMQFDNTAPKVKRGRSLKSVIPPLRAQTPEKKEAFKRSTRIGSSMRSILNFSAESTTGKDSRDSTESSTLPSPRLSRSKATNIKKIEEIEVNQNTRRNRTTLGNSLRIRECKCKFTFT